jgi:hypothetical protein
MGGRSDILGFIGTSFSTKRWLSLDTCGCFGVLLSWSVHLYALIVIAWHLISGSFILTALYLLVYVPTTCLAMVSLFMAWTTDPGAVPLGARPLVTVRRANSTASASSTDQMISKSASENGGVSGRASASASTVAGSASPIATSITALTPSLATPSASETPTLSPSLTSPAAPPNRRAVRRCHKCNDNFKPARAHHDSVTGRCVVKFDHFCPWVGNAVGAKNHKFFCLFLFYTAATCLLSLFFLLVRVIRCGYVKDSDENKGGESQYVYKECNNFYGNHVITALALASLIFLIFTCSMGCEQFEAIETGKSKIARMKMRVGSTDTEFTRVTEEFNEMFGGDSPGPQWHWMWPSAVVYPRGMEKVVLGYEWDEAFDAVPYRQDEDESSSSAVGNTNTATNERELEDMEGGLRAPSSNGAVENDGIMMTPVNSNTSVGSSSSSGSNLAKGIKKRLTRGISGGNVVDDGSTLMDRTQTQLT